MKLIRSRENAFYKALVRLASSSRARREARTTILDGVHLLQAFAANGQEAQALILRESSATSPEVAALAGTFPTRARYVLGDALFDGVAQVTSPVGIMALATTPAVLPLPASIGDAVLLDQIQDPGNLGSILRSTAAAGLRQVFLSRKSIFAWSPKVLRAGMGAHFSLEIHEDVDLLPLMKLRRGRVIATVANGESRLDRSKLKEPVAWLFGNEGAGISAELAAAADERMGIPMPGGFESLNVAAAAAVCLFEQVRQRG